MGDQLDDTRHSIEKRRSMEEAQKDLLKRISEIENFSDASYVNSPQLESFYNPKVDINKLDDNGYPPLFYAAYANNKDLCNTLIKNGANINILGHYDKTALHIASRNGNVHVAEYLLDNNAKLDAEDIFGNTPLHESCSSGDVRMCELLLSKGAYVNKKNKNFITPLMIAVIQDQSAVAELLLTASADVSIVDKNGNNAIGLAKNLGFLSIVEVLESSNGVHHQ